MRAACLRGSRAPGGAARGGEWVFPDEDDPKLARGGEVRRRLVEHTPRRAALQARLSAAVARRPTAATCRSTSAELDYYPVSRFVRFGIAGEVGYGGGKYGLWYFMTGAWLGLQWPMRVTPFLEGRFAAGIMGGSFQGQSAVSWIYEGGIDTGIEVYVARRFYLSAAIGWAHPVYGGVDVDGAQSEPDDRGAKTSRPTTFTFKVGLGL